jgi:hypothetical protein
MKHEAYGNMKHGSMSMKHETEASSMKHEHETWRAYEAWHGSMSMKHEHE